MTISQVSARSGVASSALRYYEEKGLIASIRASSGHRRFERSALRRVAFIVFAQKIGLSLEEIKLELAKLPADRTPTSKDWEKLSSKWMARVQERIDELERLKAGVSRCIGCGCLSFEYCHLANPEDREGKRGTGPRFWMGSKTTPSSQG